MACRMCDERRQTWEGEAPRCSFPDGVFDSSGWNCATANAIREFCTEHKWCDDQYHATLDISELDSPYMGEAMWVTWYKNRGRTDQIIILDSLEGARVATLEDCEAVIAWLGLQSEESKGGK